MRIIVTGGGTGGHIYPALAIARGLLAADTSVEILYVGTKRGLEADVVPKEGFPFATVSVAGLERKLSWKNIQAIMLAGKGLADAWRIVKRYQPKLVVATGGYVCAPVGLVASAMNIPVVLHEQNALPGLTNRLLAKRAKLICITFAGSAEYFPAGSPVVHTGLPVRREILEGNRDEGAKALGLDPREFTVLVTGGSRGARSINSALLDVIEHYAGQKGVQILHITGKEGYAFVQNELAKRGIKSGSYGNIILKPYVYDMHHALAMADLVIGRAGAAFLAEISAKGIPAILIPYPYAAENHQEYNAQALAANGAAIVIKDQQLTGEKLIHEIERVKNSAQTWQAMADACRKMGKPEALARIVNEILSICQA